MTGEIYSFFLYRRFAFVEYNTPDQAAAALKGLQNFKLDSKHIFSTVKLTDIDEFCSNEEEIVVPEKQEFKDPVSILLFYNLPKDCATAF